MVESPPTFGKLLLSYRRRLNLSQQKVADMGDMHTSDLSKLEREVRRKAPSLAVLLKWIEGLGLNRQEAIGFLEAAGYSATVLARTQFDPTNYPVVVASVESRLQGSEGFIPVMELNREGTIIKANLLAFQLWGALAEGDADIIPEKLLERNIFEIWSDPAVFGRIDMPEKTSDFWFVQIVLFKKLRDTLPKHVVEQFERVILSHPVLSLIFRYDTTTEIEHEWEYILRMYPYALPTFGKARIHLQFKVRAEKVMQQGELAGYLLSYQPLMPYTIKRTLRVYKKLLEKRTAEAFVQRIPDTHILEDKDKFPPPLPAFHYTQEGIVTLVNTALLTLYGEQPKSLLFRELPWFTLLMSERTEAICRTPIDNARLIIPLRDFHQRTIGLENDSVRGKTFKEVKDKLIAQLAQRGIDFFAEILTQQSPTTFKLPEIEHYIPWFPVEILSPYTDLMDLSFALYTRPPNIVEDDYRVTFIPTTHYTTITVLLLRMQADERFIQAIPQVASQEEKAGSISLVHTRQQLLWLLTVLEVVQEGCSKQKGDAGWHPHMVFLEKYPRILDENTEPLEAIRIRVEWELSTIVLCDIKQRPVTLQERRAILKTFAVFLTRVVHNPAMLLKLIPSSAQDSLPIA